MMRICEGGAPCNLRPHIRRHRIPGEIAPRQRADDFFSPYVCAARNMHLGLAEPRVHIDFPDGTKLVVGRQIFRHFFPNPRGLPGYKPEDRIRARLDFGLFFVKSETKHIRTLARMIPRYASLIFGEEVST
jgi:hypothetical protein